MKLAIATRRLHPRQVFRIARAERRFVENVFVRLEQDGVRGYGEASPNAFYQETAADVATRLSGLSDFLKAAHVDSVEDIAALWSAAWPLLAPSRAAQCALDLALWDFLARRDGRTVGDLATSHVPGPVRTFCTIGLSTPEELETKIAELRDSAAIKIKSDAKADLQPLQAVRAQSRAVLAIDANCAWRGQALPRLAEELRLLEVAFVEQPYLPFDDPLLSPGAHALPILADESCVTEDDVERVLQHFDGFNVKLVKCGGLTPALRMLARGRVAGAPTMVGCMLESSLLIAAGLVAAQGSTYADLDGAWLLSDDPCPGLGFERGTLIPAPHDGFGVHPGPEVFAAPESST